MAHLEMDDGQPAEHDAQRWPAPAVALDAAATIRPPSHGAFVGGVTTLPLSLVDRGVMCVDGGDRQTGTSKC